MSLLNAVAELAEFLEAEGIPYAVIGGLAVQYWGESRTTRDVDIVVLVPPNEADRFLERAADRFHPRIADAVSFAKQNRVLLLEASDGTPADISLGIPGYEEEVLKRAVTGSIGGSRPFRIVSAEDLVIHKVLAGRPRDLEDAERILVRQHGNLDPAYITKWLEAFTPLVEDRDLLAEFKDVLRKAQAEQG